MNYLNNYHLLIIEQ